VHGLSCIGALACKVLREGKKACLPLTLRHSRPDADLVARKRKELQELQPLGPVYEIMGAAVRGLGGAAHAVIR
jgi:hypothetical protein